MTFDSALVALRAEKRVHRLGWNGRGMWVALREPAKLPGPDGMTLPFLYMRTATGDLVPWLASQTDVLADDWQVLE